MPARSSPIRSPGGSPGSPGGTGTIPARQERSRDTEARLLAAAEQVFLRSGVPGATVAEICRTAGVAVGTFYGRFRDRSGLLAAYFDAYYRRAAESLEADFRVERWRGRALAEIVGAWVRRRVRRLRARRALTLAILAYARTHRDPAFRVAASRHSALVVARFAALLEGSAEGLRGADPRRAAVMAVSTIEALLKEMALFGEVRSPALAIPDRELVPEVTRLVLGYLETPPVERPE